LLIQSPSLIEYGGVMPMERRGIIVTVLVVVFMLGALVSGSLAKWSDPTNGEEIVNIFPADLVSAALGKPIIQTQTAVNEWKASAYYYAETIERSGRQAFVSIGFRKTFRFKRLLYNVERGGGKAEIDPKIGLDHVIVLDNDAIQSIYLGDGKYIVLRRIGRYLISDDEMRSLARKVADTMISRQKSKM
jgi:hypothetical protein